jgi:hypothetical protein
MFLCRVTSKVALHQGEADSAALIQAMTARHFQFLENLLAETSNLWKW